MSKKKQHGGKRPGSGRKPKGEVAQKKCSVAMVPAAWELLDEQRGEMSRGSWISGLVIKHDAKSRKK